jgi:hypothetical protein
MGSNSQLLASGEPLPLRFNRSSVATADVFKTLFLCERAQVGKFTAHFPLYTLGNNAASLNYSMECPHVKVSNLLPR